MIEALEHVRGTRWTEAQVRAEAKKYKSRSELYRGANSAYDTARRIGILDDIFPSAYTDWDLEKLKVEASKFGTKEAFRHGCASGHSYAHKHGFIKILFPNARPYRRWNEDEVRLEARKYHSKKAFKNGCEPAYQWSIKHEIIDELFANQLTTWTDELVRVEAKKYRTKFEFQKGCQAAYNYAKRNNMLKDMVFQPGKSTFLFSLPSLLYVVDTVLTDGSKGIMFGITNRDNPCERYLKTDRSLMSNRVAYKFSTGREAHAMESCLKREFREYHIKQGLSPFKGSPGPKGKMGCKEKKGTTGEILYATAGRENLANFIKEKCPDCGAPFIW